jgi:hypothetical protein
MTKSYPAIAGRSVYVVKWQITGVRHVAKNTKCL